LLGLLHLLRSPIGTTRTSRRIGLMSVIEGKAAVGSGWPEVSD